MEDYLKIPEVARRLDVSEKTARRLVKSGSLPAVFVGGAYRVSEVDLAGYLESAKVTPGKAPASPPDFAGERRVDVYGMVLAAARRQAEQDLQATNRALESERPQTYFMRHENEVVVRLLEECAPDAVAGTLVEMARRCVQLESQLSKEATSAEPARSATT
jgi:excisionase family DNA binding protein